MIRAAQPQETQELVQLAVDTGLFTADEADMLLRQTLDDLHAGRLGEQHFAYVSHDSKSAAQGWAYFSMNPKADGVWDLWWIGVARKGQGVGTQLLNFVEEHVRSAAGRILIIETSSSPALAATRSFYARRGYTNCGEIPNFYGDGDHKMTFAKGMAPPPAAGV